MAKKKKAVKKVGKKVVKKALRKTSERTPGVVNRKKTSRGTSHKGPRPLRQTANPLRNQKESAKLWNQKRSERQTGSVGFEETEVTAGNYMVRMTKAEWATPEINNITKFMFVTEYEILSDPDWAGTLLQNRGWLDDGASEQAATGMGFLASRLQSMGLDTASIDWDDLPALTESLTQEQPLLEVSVRYSSKVNTRTGWGYQNVWVVRPITEEQDGDEDEE